MNDSSHNPPPDEPDSPDVASSPSRNLAPWVFFPAAALIFLFVVVTLSLSFPVDEADPKSVTYAEQFFNAAKSFVTDNTGWLMIFSITIFFGFIVYLAMSRYGQIRLGGAGAEPEFSTWAWVAMLFSAGMGIGLLFWSIAEPYYHFTGPPTGEAGTVDAAKQAMNITFFHWGLHGWAVYAIVGLALAFFTFNKNLPLTIRTAFRPLFGNKVNGWIGHVIDTSAVVATMFGVATSLGFGASQVGGGFEHLFGIENGAGLQTLVIAGITGIATISVVTGLNGGIKRLSQFNMISAGTLLVAVLLLGPTLFLLNSIVGNIGRYLEALPRMTLWTASYISDEGIRNPEPASTWIGSWTVFYWAWWISWAPFVGMFIARISKGRTIREFVIGVLVVPCFITFVWMTIFGGTALHDILSGDSTIADAISKEGPEMGLYALLDGLPGGTFLSGLAVLAIISFFVTSSDSGSLVIDTITSGGNTHPPVWQRIFWAVTEGIVAAVLLIGGGLGALQTATVVTGLPFTIVLWLMCWSLLRALRHYLPRAIAVGESTPQSIPGKEDQ